MFLCKPSCCRPEASAEGSLGTCVPRDDIPGRCPERSEGDAVPSEARDASLSLGRTKEGSLGGTK
jgi:hypothetical protein